MEKLSRIIQRCKCGFYLEVNTHKDDYLSAQDRIDYLLSIAVEDISDDMQKKMIELDSIVELTCYVDTPIGSHRVYHYSVDSAIDEMFNILGLSLN
jgi:hypothetical protein